MNNAQSALVVIMAIPASAVGQLCVDHIAVPKYPTVAWAAQWTGVVNLTLNIGEQGQVEDVKGTGAVPYLVEQAKENVKQWTLCANHQNGSAHVRLRYNYRLEGAKVYPVPAAKVVLDLDHATVTITSHPGAPQP